MDIYNVLQWLSVMSLYVNGMEYPPDDYFSPVNFSLAEPLIDGQVTFTIFKNSHEPLDMENVSCPFRLENIPTKVFIHGWLSSAEASIWFNPLRDAYLSKGPHNIIYVDYKSIAAKLYSIASASSRNVGKAIANFLLSVNIDLDLVHLLGHSLGAHVAGFVGKETVRTAEKKIGRISALDPAGPKFHNNSVDERLNPEDATFVDVTHTASEMYGIEEPLGHVDFYPNGGKRQPGCPLRVDDNCSHARSHLYFLESVNVTKIALGADSWDQFIAGKKLVNKTAIFGDGCPAGTRGSYYFETNAESPFLTVP